jgi:hypothetical protein
MKTAKDEKSDNDGESVTHNQKSTKFRKDDVEAGLIEMERTKGQDDKIENNSSSEERRTEKRRKNGENPSRRFK